MQLSLIITVLNEQNTILQFIESVFNQSRLPDEFIIVDGGSSDNTVAIIKNERSKVKNYNGKFMFLVKKGNRSVGRNEAIKNAKGEIILCSDAGCILDKNWIRNITKPFEDPKTDLVAGYYKGLPKTIFEKCLIPYVLVMEEKINEKDFLPASRSIAFRKKIWEKVGGFPEQFSNNEDYVFARSLKKINAKTVFVKKAIAYWIPRKNLKEAFIMFYRFAKGDSESRIFRSKVILIFVRYIVIIFILLFLAFKSYAILNTLYLILLTYALWSIIKNYKYVKDTRAIFFLPLMQFTSDIAVISGTIEGFISFYKFPLNERHQQ